MDHQSIVDLTNLSNELMYRRFLVNNDEVRQFFYELTVPEYIALNLIIENEANDPIYGGKTYLSDLAERLQRPMRTISSIARNLRDKGFVIWSHDGDGEQGTYVTITEEGRRICTFPFRFLIFSCYRTTHYLSYDFALLHFAMVNTVLS